MTETILAFNASAIHMNLSSITSVMEYACINNLHGIFKEHLSLSVEKNSMCRIGSDSLITCFTKLFRTCCNSGVLVLGVHRHFVLYGLMEYLRKSLDRQFSSDEVLQLLDRFFNLEMLKPEDDEKDNFRQGEEFSLPESFLNKEE
ncbi:uncharacterized protein LOC100273660 [Zea mays]|uniref:Uncharacterized protein n=1 Tax=Zea mays TaxID=4577 RepID=B4FWU8_MAIZE|nr:uncharacterized protein LOC100273660 [Zea mays]ACF86591.2 unknown [Zea mays]|eukprot:NP_001141546.2 uncharacterized protein LOC100273660 [Zea mays]